MCPLGQPKVLQGFIQYQTKYYVRTMYAYVCSTCILCTRVLHITYVLLPKIEFPKLYLNLTSTLLIISMFELHCSGTRTLRWVQGLGTGHQSRSACTSLPSTSLGLIDRIDRDGSKNSGSSNGILPLDGALKMRSNNLLYLCKDCCNVTFSKFRVL